VGALRIDIISYNDGGKQHTAGMPQNNGKTVHLRGHQGCRAEHQAESGGQP